MARYILGIDTGSACIKLVLAREGFKKFEIVQCLKGEIKDKGMEETLVSLLGQLSHSPDTIVTAIPGAQVSIHYLQFPFIEDTKISQIVPSEVENITPFPLDEIMMDHWIVEKDKSRRESHVLVGIIKKEFLLDYLAIWKKININPHMVDVEPVALFHAFAHFHRSSNNAGILDIGEKRSNFCIVQESRPAFIRAYSKGMTQVEDLLKELRLSIHAFETKQGKPVEKIYITGGGVYIPDIVPHIAEGLSRPVEIFYPPQGMAGDIPCEEKELPLFITSIGLAIRGQHRKKTEGFNFLKGEYSFQERTQVLTRKLLYTGIGIFLVIILGIGDFYLHYQYRLDRYRDLKNEIRQIYINTFPGTRHIVDEIQQTKSAIKAIRKKIMALGGSKEVVSPLYILKAISEKIPQELEIEVEDFLIDKSRFRIQGTTNSFEDVEKIRRAISNLSFLEHVTVGDARLAADQKKVKFRIVADLKEESNK